jgi:hypothetical protein
MELFHIIDVEEVREVYKKNIPCFVMAEWDGLVLCCSNNLPVTVYEKLIDGSFELCFCCEDSPSMEVINLPCGKARGYFLHQLDGNNCGPITYMKIMELFCDIDVKKYVKCTKKYTRHFVMAEWDGLVLCCSNDLPVTVYEKSIDGSFELCFCCEDSP